MRCLICDHEAHKVFDLPSNKMTGGPMDVDGYPVDYFKCSHCDFLFANHKCTYDDENYWGVVEPVDDGRALQTAQLFYLAGGDITKTVLDYGCGKGFGVTKLKEMGYDAYGADICLQDLENYTTLDHATPKDIAVACEVVEHFTDPVASFKHFCSLGTEAIAFQTAYQDGNPDRMWWYLGPANGHTSLYSPKSLKILAEQNYVKKVKLKDNYIGIQAWFF